MSKKKKPKFKVDDKVMLLGETNQGCGGDHKWKRHMSGASHYVVTKVHPVRFHSFDSPRYDLKAVISNARCQEIWKQAAWKDPSFQLDQFRGYRAKENYIIEDWLRKYLKKDMDIEYTVTADGDVMYVGPDRKKTKGWKVDTPWVSISIVERDLNTSTTVKTWSNRQEAS